MLTTTLAGAHTRTRMMCSMQWKYVSYVDHKHHNFALHYMYKWKDFATRRNHDFCRLILGRIISMHTENAALPIIALRRAAFSSLDPH